MGELNTVWVLSLCTLSILICFFVGQEGPSLHPLVSWTIAPALESNRVSKLASLAYELRATVLCSPIRKERETGETRKRGAAVG